MKKIAALLLAFVLFLMLLPFGPDIALAADELSFVEDRAGLLSEAQQMTLEKRASDLSAKYQCNVLVFTVSDMADYGYRRNIDEFAYNYYTQFILDGDRGNDCVLLVLSMADRDSDLRAWGDYAKTAFSLYGIDNMLDKHVLSPLGSNDYYRAFTAFFDRAEQYFEMAENGRPFDAKNDPSKVVGRLVIAFVISVLIALLVCLVWRSKMKTARLARSADNYIPEGGFRLTGQGDWFLYRTVTRRKIEKSTSSGGGSGGARSGGVGGSSGRSGKF